MRPGERTRQDFFMTCETCRDAGKYGTVYFDYKTKKWKHTEKEGLAVCAKPMPV